MKTKKQTTNVTSCNFKEEHDLKLTSDISKAIEKHCQALYSEQTQKIEVPNNVLFGIGCVVLNNLEFEISEALDIYKNCNLHNAKIQDIKRFFADIKKKKYRIGEKKFIEYCSMPNGEGRAIDKKQLVRFYRALMSVKNSPQSRAFYLAKKVNIEQKELYKRIIKTSYDIQLVYDDLNQPIFTKEVNKNKDLLEIHVRNPYLFLIETDHPNELQFNKVIRFLDRHEIPRVSYKTGGRGYHALVYLENDLKHYELEDIKKFGNWFIEWIKTNLENEVKNLEIKHGVNTFIPTWYGKHRKTKTQRSNLTTNKINSLSLDFLISHFKNKNILHVKNEDLKTLLEKNLIASKHLLLDILIKGIKISKQEFYEIIKNIQKDFTDKEFKISKKTKNNIINKLKEGPNKPKYIPTKNLKNELLFLKQIENKYKKLKELDENYIFIDIETTQEGIYAHDPTLIVLFIPKLQRIVAINLKEIKENEIYKENNLELRIIYSNNPKDLFEFGIPEIYLLDKITKYLVNGSDLALFDDDLSKFTNVNIDWIVWQLTNQKKFFFAGHNLIYDIPIFLDYLQKETEKEVLKVEDNEYKFFIELHSGNLEIHGKISKVLGGNAYHPTGFIRFSSIYFKFLDTLQLANFYTQMPHDLKYLSEQFNTEFKKQSFDTSYIGKDFYKDLEYCIGDVFTSYELSNTIPSKALDKLQNYLKKVKIKVKKNNKDKNILKIDEWESFTLDELYNLKKTNLKSSASLPKNILENLITKYDVQKYIQNTKTIEKMLKPLYYGGIVWTSGIGVFNNVRYYDFKSQYPSCMNIIGMENILLNMCSYNISELIVNFDRNIQQIIEEAIDTSIKNKNLKYIFQLLKKHPYGIIRIRSCKLPFTKYIPATNTKGHFATIERVVDGIDLDLQDYISILFEWRINGHNWSEIFKKLVIDKQKSIVFDVKNILKTELENGTILNSPIYSLLHIRAEIKEKMKNANNKEEYNKLYAEQYAIKQLVNASYGIFASSSWKEETLEFGNYLVANSVTATAHLLSLLMKKVFELYNIKTYYIDTDGIVTDNYKECEEAIAWINEVDELELERIEDKRYVLGTKNYKSIFNNDTEIKIGGRGGYTSWCSEKTFSENYFNKLYDWLLGGDNYAEKEVRQITYISNKNAETKKHISAMKPTKNKIQEIKNNRYFIKNGVVYTHLLNYKTNPTGKFFKIVKIKGTLNGKEVNSIVSSFFDKDIATFIKENNLEIVEKKVNESVQGRLNTLNTFVKKYSKAITVSELKKAMENNTFLKLPIPKYTLVSKKPLWYGLQDYELHTMEFYAPITLKKPTSIKAHVRHYSILLASISKTAKLIGMKHIEKNNTTLIFNYSYENNNGKITITEGDIINPIRVMIDFKALDINIQEMQSNIKVTIDIDSLGKEYLFYKILGLTISKLKKDIENIFSSLVISFGAQTVNYSNFFLKILESMLVSFIGNEFKNCLEKLKFQAISKHFAIDVNTNTNVLAEMQYILQKMSLNELRNNLFENTKGRLSWIQKDLPDVSSISNTDGTHLVSRNIRCSIYNRHNSKLNRIVKKYNKNGSKKLFKQISNAINENNENVYRIEVQIFGVTWQWKGLEIFSVLKELFKILQSKAFEIKKGIGWKGIDEFYEGCVKDIIKDCKKLKKVTSNAKSIYNGTISMLVLDGYLKNLKNYLITNQPFQSKIT